MKVEEKLWSALKAASVWCVDSGSELWIMKGVARLPGKPETETWNFGTKCSARARFLAGSQSQIHRHETHSVDGRDARWSAIVSKWMGMRLNVVGWMVSFYLEHCMKCHSMRGVHC